MFDFLPVVMIMSMRLVVFLIIFELSSESEAKFNCGNKARPLGFVRNGSVTTENEWPWLANLIHVPSGRFFCGGTLIMAKRVLTAAHCIQEKYSNQKLKPDEVEVQLGRFNLNVIEPRSKSFRSKKIIIHPDWDPMNDRYDADLALIISDKNMESVFILPICLPSQSSENSDENVEGTIVGWGFSDDSKHDHENVPRMVQVMKVALEKCLLEDNKIAEISSERTFCITGVKGGGGPCKGDSGGGFFVETEGVWYIHGIVSSAITASNCPETKHSVMTKIDVFIDWIKQNVTYGVSFTYKLKHDSSGNFYHQLTIPEVLRRGAFLSQDGRFTDWTVKQIRLNDQNLIYFPSKIGNLFPNLNSLYARNSQIKFIERRNFQNLSRLTHLFLENNLIEEIPFDTFHNLESLRGVYIANNLIEVIQPNTFAFNPTLVRISLQNNRIKTLESRSFSNKNIEKLHLNQNLLESISRDAFDGLGNLRKLDLSDNKLKTLHKDAFLNNPRLQSLDVNRNLIERLDQGLFENNQDLNDVNFENNQLSEIYCEFLQLGIYNFQRNICIDKLYNFTFQLNEINRELKQMCRK